MIPQLAAQKKRSRIALKGLRRAEIQSGVVKGTRTLDPRNHNPML